jgi:hypothetical protein
MKSLNQFGGGNRNGVKPFFPAYFNPPERADFPFTRKEQVVF